MAELGSLRRPGVSPFPIVRKSGDPMQPEMGEMDFSQDMVEFERQISTEVLDTEKAEQTHIRDENRRKQYRQRKKRPLKNDSQKETTEEQSTQPSLDHIIDIQA